MIESFDVCKNITTGKYFLLCLTPEGAQFIEGDFETLEDAKIASELCHKSYLQGFRDKLERKENQHPKEFENLLSNISGLMFRTDTTTEKLAEVTGIEELEEKFDGEFPLTLDETKRLADYFKVSINDLIYKNLIDG